MKLQKAIGKCTPVLYIFFLAAKLLHNSGYHLYTHSHTSRTLKWSLLTKVTWLGTHKRQGCKRNSNKLILQSLSKVYAKNFYNAIYTGIERDKTMTHKLMYIRNDNTQNYPFCPPCITANISIF